MTSYLEITSFSDFENDTIRFPGHIFYGLGDQICIKSGINWVKIAQIGIFLSQNVSKMAIFYVIMTSYLQMMSF